MAGLEAKFSAASVMPFHRMKVRLKKEIVTMGVDEIDPLSDAGAYVEPLEWNALIADPDTVVIDTRNDYEVALGAFRNAVDPGTATFREFPEWVANNRQALEGRRIAMYCTGGIRCEKATAYVRSLGLPEVYHLKGGILKYLETVPAEQSLWQGECFVFDERVSVTHGLAEGEAELCRACRRPLTAPIAVAALSRGHIVRLLPRRAQRRGPRSLCRAAATGAAGAGARGRAAYRQLRPALRLTAASL